MSEFYGEDIINVSEGTFRVPDLRGQFIRSAYLESNRDEGILKGTVGSHRYSQLPMADSDKVSSEPTSNDKHAHYSFYGSYEAEQFGSDGAAIGYSGSDENYGGKTVALLSGYSSIRPLGIVNSLTFPGVKSAAARNYDGKENHMPTHYYMTAPQIYDAINYRKNGCSIDTGVTTRDISAVDTSAKIGGTNGAYNGKTDFLAEGMENAPSFIGVLPFIRI